MTELNNQQFGLCDIQGRLFELALKNGYDCKDFIEKFMNSKTAAALDETYDRLQWAGEEYILEELNEEVGGLKKAGTTYHNEIMYWSGYTYRYWRYYTGETSKEIYTIANAERMATVYLGFHTLDVQMAIDRLREVYNTKDEEAVQKFDKAKRIKDAEDVIEQINEILSDSSLFRRKVDSLYDKIIKNIDYTPFIATAKAASGMGGNIPFKQLPYLPKRSALIMIRDAIRAYVVAEIAKKENKNGN